MDEQEKSLELAKMMKWDICKPLDTTYVRSNIREGWQPLSPYSSYVNGRAQFAAILLKFPEVILKFHMDKKCTWSNSGDLLTVPNDSPPQSYRHYVYYRGQLTQYNFLDEILRINGVNPDE